MINFRTNTVLSTQFRVMQSQYVASDGLVLLEISMTIHRRLMA